MASRNNSDSTEWAVSMDITVNWGDMDALGHVNHSVFATWMETARMEYFSKMGMMELYENSNIGPILARIEVDYKFPIVFPDVVKVLTSVSRIGNSSFDMKYEISSLAKEGEVAATGKVVGVLVDYNTGKPVPMPEELKNSIIELEGGITSAD
ncbi:MAG: thioesterase family protein [Candidatus Thermoplasmatota archaeon]|nr:thioesterase family protein [Candidatus Thermoplasmatota archaeon]